MVLNLNAGMGGDLVTGPPSAPLPQKKAATDMASAAERVEHIAACRPEICTLDCGTMNFAKADYVITNTPGMLREMAGLMRDIAAFGLKLKRLTPAICGLLNNWHQMVLLMIRLWFSCVWAFPGVHLMT